MKKILVIEDSDDIRENLVEILDLASYQTFAATNGKDGVGLAIAHLPDLILCDIMMPELDGYGVLYMLQKNTATASIPFIFMTAKAERSDMRKGMEMGADDYLTKPFDDLELFKAIDARLKRAKHTGSANSKAGKDAVLAELKEKGKLRNFPGKQILYVENDDPTNLYFIKKGMVKTYQRAADGRELSSMLYSDGDFFGYESLCSGTKYGDNAATMVNSELLLIAKSDFMDYLLKHQEIANAFLNLLSSSIRDKEAQMLKLAYFSVRKRVAEALIKVAAKFGDGISDRCTVKISRDDLAALVGTASETISRMLADFKNEKLIDKIGNAIEIISLLKLSKIRQ
jgi:CheY-like chemotaxis protein